MEFKIKWARILNESKDKVASAFSHITLKANMGSGVKVYAVLTSAVDRREWLASPLWKELPKPSVYGSKWCIRLVEKRFCPCRESNPGRTARGQSHN